jgi:hypothetical protein
MSLNSLQIFHLAGNRALTERARRWTTYWIFVWTIHCPLVVRQVSAG